MSDLFENYATVRPVENQEDLNAISEACHTDNHKSVFPTHIVQKDGEIVGYASMCRTPLVNFWLHSQKIKPRESLMMIQLFENLARAQGCESVVVPCSENSPFFSLMEKMGYSPLGKTVMFAKQIKGK